jgi:hypothetical protein
MSPENLTRILRTLGATRVLAKRLAPNDNSKNQIYLGGDYSALNLIPFGELVEDGAVVAGSKRSRLKASVDFAWVDPRGNCEDARKANLILYPKYPEVRLSGILAGVKNKQPSSVIATRDMGRWLFLGITDSARILGFAAPPRSPIAIWAEGISATEQKQGVFIEFPLRSEAVSDDMIQCLHRIAAEGWIPSQRLDANGTAKPCNAENCGGYTLEAELGIRPNGKSEPDYHGWEVKQFAVTNLEKPVGGAITLFTPEPDGGYYKNHGVEAFLRRFGYISLRNIKGRIDFGGVHRFGELHPRTGLRLDLQGWNLASRTLEDMHGGIHLTTATGECAAMWSFRALINHWKRKHSQAVYVPCNMMREPRQYRYGFNVFIGKDTEFPLFLEAISKGLVFYDPGIKLEVVEGRNVIKRRSQFRVGFKNLPSLYRFSGWWDLRKIHRI